MGMRKGAKAKDVPAGLESKPVAAVQKVLGVEYLTIKRRLLKQLSVCRNVPYDWLEENTDAMVGWFDSQEGLDWAYSSRALIVYRFERLEVWDVGHRWLSEKAHLLGEVPQILVD